MRGTHKGRVGSLTRRDRAIAALVPAVLLFVALHQVVLATTADLTPWKGGGFGMFATADRLDTRVVRSYLAVDGDWIPVASESKPRLAAAGHLEALQRLQAQPSRGHAQDWAQALAASGWRHVDGTARIDEEAPASQHDPAVPVIHVGQDAIDIDAVGIEVWRTTYDRQWGRVVPERVAVRVVETGDLPR